MWEKLFRERWPQVEILLNPSAPFRENYRRQLQFERRLEEMPDHVRTLVEQLPQAMQQLRSADIAAHLAGSSYIRKVVSVERDPPIQEAVDVGAIPYLVQFLDVDAHPQLQLEAAWALSNMASGTIAQCQAVVDGGCVDKFVRLLRSPDTNVAEQAVWALVRRSQRTRWVYVRSGVRPEPRAIHLTWVHMRACGWGPLSHQSQGNIAGDNSATRDLCLNAGAIDGVLALMASSHTQRPSVVSNTMWAMSNLCRGMVHRLCRIRARQVCSRVRVRACV